VGTVKDLTGSSGFLLTNGVCDMYVIDERTTNAPIGLEQAEILNFGRILQKFAEFDGIQSAENLQNSTELICSWQISTVSRMLASAC